MNDSKDPLNSFERITNNNDDNTILNRERAMVRSFLPPMHPSSQSAYQFAESLTYDHNTNNHHNNHQGLNADEVRSYTDSLPPIQVLLRGISDEDTDENRATITHNMKFEKNEIRQQMNEEITATKLKYENFKNTSKNNNRSRTSSLIEDRIRKKRDSIIADANPNNQNSMTNQTPPSTISQLEHFTSPGKILNQQEELLFSNKFEPTRVLQHDSSREFKQGFRRYYEAKRDNEEKLAKIKTTANDLIKTNNFEAPSTTSSLASAHISSDKNQLTDAHENDRYNKPRVSAISIDSADRNKSLYPDANNFKIALGNQFRNVKRIVILSSEFPNTDLVVRDDPAGAKVAKNGILLRCGEILNSANNNLYWINDEDAVSEDIYNTLIYDAILNPGNYTETTLKTELEQKVASVNHFIDGTPHQFIVTINTQTNIVSIVSIESIVLGLDPISTMVATNIITVSQLGHQFDIGDTITITNAESVGGIGANILNASHTITEITSDSYSFRISQIATGSTTGGGANVLAGQNKAIKLLFSNIDTIGAILGFPQEDSSEQIANDIEFIDISPPNLAFTPLEPSDAGTLPARITSSLHDLRPGDEILIMDTNTIPGINGINTVTRVINENEFEIGIPIKVVNNQTETKNTVLGTVVQTLDSQITVITTLTSALKGNITTSVNHNYNPDNFIFIGNVIGGITSNNENINGIQTVKSNIAPTAFDIVNGVAFAGFDIGNAFTFQTTSTSLVPIDSIIPQNNGVIEPDAVEPVFVGTQVPNYVFFRNLGNITPDIDGTSSGILQVSYYSQSTGRFDLTTPILSIGSQTASQQFIRSADAGLRTISDAFITSNGTFRLNIPHNLESGNRIYVRSLIPDISSSEPQITPDITGIRTIKNILNTLNFDTTTTITSSTFTTGDIAYILTDDKVSTSIQNIFPFNNNYIGLNINNCRFPNCSICPDSPIVIDQSYLRSASTSNIRAAFLEETTSITPLSGVYTVNQIYNSSSNFNNILDLQDIVLDVLPIPISTVSAAIGIGVQHTITFYYDFCTIMQSNPTTGTVVFGGSPQLGLSTDTLYSFSYTNPTQTTFQILITTLTNNFVGPSVSPVLGTFYVKSLYFNTGMEISNPYGSCYIVNTSGGTLGTNGTSGNTDFQEVGGGIINASTDYLHGLQTGDLIYIISEIINTPSSTNPVRWLISNVTGSAAAPTFHFDFPSHDIVITQTWNGAGNPPRYQVNGNVNLDISIFTPNTISTTFINGVSGAGTFVFPTNTLPSVNLATYSVSTNISAVTLGDPAGKARIESIDLTGGNQRYLIAFTPKIGSSRLLQFSVQTVNVIDGNTFQISLGSISGSGYTGSFEYIAICGQAIPIETYFPNSWPGLFESKYNTLSSDIESSIYIGKAIEAGTTPFPIDPFAIADPVNGYLGNVTNMMIEEHEFESPLNYRFFSSTDLFMKPIIVGEFNTTVTEYVNVLSNTEEINNIIDITPANNGIIEQSVPHGFVGGERLYFMGNVNINNGVSNDLRDNFFNVSSIDPVNDKRFSIDVPLSVIGNGNVGAIAQGNFFRTPPEEVGHNILNIYPKTNGVFFSSLNHNLNATVSSQLFITNNTMAPTYDQFAQATAFRNPAPIPNALQFDSDIIITPDDIGITLDNNKVDIVNTNNALFPSLSGMSWVTAPFTQKIPISTISRDSAGTISPVSASLALGDIIYIKSTHTTNADLNGFFTVSYIDLGSNAYFELANVIISNIGSPIISPGSMIYFRTPDFDTIATINSLSKTGDPTTITATLHGFPIQSNINVVVFDTQTFNPIDVGNVNVINDAFVFNENEIDLPHFNNGNVNANLAVVEIFNETNLFISKQGIFSKKILSSNCGDANLSVDPINNRTIVETTSRINLNTKLMFQIINSAPSSAGSAVVIVQLSQGYSQLPWTNGETVVISGHIGGFPYIDGTYQIFAVGLNSFKILPSPPSNFLSTNGIGGFVTGPAPPTIPGHGLFTDDLVTFRDSKTEPSLDGRIFPVTVLDGNTFSIPIVVTPPPSYRTVGTWCSNLINMEIPDHGLSDDDIFFLYGADSVGGVQPENLNTIHGNKRKNIITPEEKATRKFARIVDGNNIQFLTNYDAFPSARVLDGGYTICISSSSATNTEKEAGFFNYGFSAIQTNKDCLGQNASFINLNNQSYVLATSEILDHMYTTGPVSECFAKIQLNAPSGQICYNTYVSTEKIFDTPIARLDEIDLAIYRTDGTLFDLRGRDYTLTLQIEEYQDRLRNAEVSSRRGISDRGAISQIGAIESTISAENPSQNILDKSQFLATTSLTQRVKVQNNSS